MSNSEQQPQQQKLQKQPQQQQQQYVKQVDGVGFSLAGKVGKRERIRIESVVEAYIRRNYDLIRSHFEEGGVANSASTAVRLCINRANNKVTIVSVNGAEVAEQPDEVAKAPAAVARTDSTRSSSANSGRIKCQKRQRKSAVEAAAAEKLQEKAAVEPEPVPEDPPPPTDTYGESMEAAIQYLMSKDEKGGVSANVRLFRSSIPNMSATNNSVVSAKATAPRLPEQLTVDQQKKPQRKQQQVKPKKKKQQQMLQPDTSCNQSTTEETTTTAAAVMPASNIRLVGDGYDCSTKGAAFRNMFPTVRGDFFVFYDHGEAHCRNILTAMGFTERKEEDETNGYRNIDIMAIMWCNGAISANKRKRNLGFHIVNRVRYRGLMTNKCSLVRTLAEFEVNHPYLVPNGLEAASFLPPSVHLNGARAIDIFHKIRNRGLYLIKPGYSDCGKGIVLYRSDGTMDSLIGTLTASYPSYPQKDLVLQKYVENPLLLGGKKFDLRVFLLVVPNQRKEVGVYAFVHPGYIRLACRDFDIDSNDLTLHLTNQAVQHRDKTYRTVKESTVWSPDTLNDFLNDRLTELKVPCLDWVKRRLMPRVRAILGHVVSIVSSSLNDEPMSYELFGCDFLIDDEFNVWLLEVNSDPSLNKSTKVLRQIVTQVVEEGVALAVEVLQRAVRGAPIKSLVMQQDYKKVFSHTNESVLRCVMGENRIRYPQHFVKS